MQVQKLRLQRAWSQEQLADLSGLSVRTIQRLEQGQTPSLETQKALASVFEINLDALKDPEMVFSPEPALRTDEALALAHVRKVKAFYIHLAQYGVVICLLALVNLMTSPAYLWFLWPALGWGAGLLMHGLRVFDTIPFFNGDWERREVEKRLGRKL